MNRINKQAIMEALKEIGRLAFFGALSAVLAWATTQIAGLDPNSVYAIAGTLVLRFLDKWVHENDNVQAKGLAPF